MPEEGHEKKLTPKHYTTMPIKTSRQDSIKHLPHDQVSLQPSIDELVAPLVVRAHHFPALALERQVLEPLTCGASELHRLVEAIFIRSVLC